MDQKFWSHGTPLGSLGPLSQQDTILGAGQLQILVIWGPYRHPTVVAFETQAENPKTAGLQTIQCGGINFRCLAAMPEDVLAQTISNFICSIL